MATDLYSGIYNPDVLSWIANPFAFIADFEDEEEESPAPVPKKAEKKKPAPVVKAPAPKPAPRPVAPASRVSPAYARPSSVAPRPKEKPAEKLTIDTSGVVVGSKLLHKKFGTGTVVEMKNGMMAVRFSQGEKKFQFPQAIQQGFLKTL